MRRTGRVALGLAAVIVVGVVAGTRRVPSGWLAWQAASGRARVAPGRGLFLPRWSWTPGGALPLTAKVAATTQEGARVQAAVVASLPAGAYALRPAATAEEGLAAALEGDLRGRVAALPMVCFAGIALPSCPPTLDGDLSTAAAVRLGAPVGTVAVRVTPDAETLATARGMALRLLVGKPARRVLVVGWDGADWELLEPFARRGVMPNLARLMAAGSWGELQSITPLLSPLIWTSMATGVGPEEHGILDFLEAEPASGAKVPVTGRQRRVPALWNMVSAAGLSTAVSGWWASWPAEVVRGTMVSDRLFFLLSDTVAAGPEGTVVFPPEREKELRELAARAARETDEQAVTSLLPVSSAAFRKAVAEHRGMADPVDGFRRILVGTRTYFGAALQLADARPDLTMVYCIGTDEVGHVLSPYLPPALPGADPAFSETARIGVERYFSVVDRWLGRLVESCPEKECAVLIVSDHGFKWGADRPRDFSGVAAATAALWHRPRGVFILAGNGVARRGRVTEVPSIYDVAPTIAALLGMPAGTTWRGKPLPGAPAARAGTLDWTALLPADSYRPQVGSSQPSAEYVKQLQALGYVGGGEGAGQARGKTEGELNNLGLVQLEAKRYAEAESAFLDVIARYPAYPSPHYNLRRLYFETGRYDDADRALWQAVERGLRDGAGAVDRAATDYEAHDMTDRALGLLAGAARRFPGEPRFAVHELALLVKAGRCADAAGRGREYAARFAANAAVHAFYGMAAACGGDAETAHRALRRSLELDPDQPEVRQALQALSGGPS